MPPKKSKPASKPKSKSSGEANARGGRKKAEAPLVQARLDEVLQLRLDGAARHDICQYVSAQEQAPSGHWTLRPGEGPMSGRQVARYIEAADQAVKAMAAEIRQDAFDQQLAMLMARYAACCTAGDNATALACLRDRGKLLGLYPAGKVSHEHSGKDGKPIEVKGTDPAASLAPYAAVISAFLAGGGPGQAAPEVPRQPVRGAEAAPQAGTVPAA